MKDRAKVIFGNALPEKAYKSAVKTGKKNAKKFGDDRNVSYEINIEKNAHIGDELGVMDVQVLEEGKTATNLEGFDTEKG
ncbi:MAG: hypothetical protein IJ274_12000, partial [Lachnospiraceae bacterium]|nr:hypothetical protein [Lachnospiraceae bacterium]